MTAHKPRQFNRYKLNTLARVRRNGVADWTEVRVDSISSMGASFEHTRTFKESDSIEFFMPNPATPQKPYHLSAKVVWINDSLVGVEFTGAL
jgi:hypothetical protein